MAANIIHTLNMKKGVFSCYVVSGVFIVKLRKEKIES